MRLFKVMTVSTSGPVKKKRKQRKEKSVMRDLKHTDQISLLIEGNIKMKMPDLAPITS